MDLRVKQEVMETLNAERRKLSGVVREQTASVIELSSSSSDSDSSDSDDLDVNVNANGVVSAVEGPEARASKKRKVNDVDFVLPLGFLAPLPPDDPAPAPLAFDMALAEVSEPVNPLEQTASRTPSSNVLSISKQFWKAGDYDGAPSSSWELSTGGMDHVRVHPKFLHSNATSHKWALGAFAELLDNSLDEVCNGATYVNVDVSKNKKDGNRMLVIEDNGGGMDPDKMRQCMSLGYSAKSKIANTIGQYGNGFKTSTMRLGADVIVFSRCCGKDGNRPTQSIGLLSYTFLTSTGKEDIVVPMLDYEWQQDEWSKLARSTVSDWDRNVETIVQWSPFSSEADLLRQFNLMKDHGTRIIIFNLWEDDQGLSELDFHADEYDIQLRGVNRDEKNIQMAKEFPNSRHFLTYRHSLRSYASIIYLRLPPNFRIILRGKDVEHHNIVNAVEEMDVDTRNDEEEEIANGNEVQTGNEDEEEKGSGNEVHTRNKEEEKGNGNEVQTRMEEEIAEEKAKGNEVQTRNEEDEVDRVNDVSNSTWQSSVLAGVNEEPSDMVIASVLNRMGEEIGEDGSEKGGKGEGDEVIVGEVKEADNIEKGSGTTELVVKGSEGVRDPLVKSIKDVEVNERKYCGGKKDSGDKSDEEESVEEIETDDEFEGEKSTEVNSVRKKVVTAGNKSELEYESSLEDDSDSKRVEQSEDVHVDGGEVGRGSDVVEDENEENSAGIEEDENMGGNDGAAPIVLSVGELNTRMDNVGSMQARVTFRDKMGKHLEVLKGAIMRIGEIIDGAGLGYFFELDEKNWRAGCGSILHFFLLREIECKKKNELWFKVGNKPIRFSLKEFCLVSGLKCHPYPSKQLETKAQVKGKAFVNQLKKSLRTTKLRTEHLLEVLKEEGKKKRFSIVDKSRCAAMYLLHTVILGSKAENLVSDKYLAWTVTPEFFKSYPWGRVSYEKVVKNLDRDLCGKAQNRKTKVNKGNAEGMIVTYTISCFWQAFIVWVYEAVSVFGENLGGRSTEEAEAIPRLLRWHRGIQEKNVHLEYMEDLVSLNEFEAIPMLRPSEEESRSEWMAGFVEMEDEDDPQIDSLRFQLKDIIVLHPCDGIGPVSTGDENRKESPLVGPQSKSSDAANDNLQVDPPLEQSHADGGSVLERISSLENEVEELKKLTAFLNHELIGAKAKNMIWTRLNRSRSLRKRKVEAAEVSNQLKTAVKRIRKE